jgi:hypothetical protein
MPEQGSDRKLRKPEIGGDRRIGMTQYMRRHFGWKGGLCCDSQPDLIEPMHKPIDPLARWEDELAEAGH